MLEWATRKENCQHASKYKTKHYYVKVKKICPITNNVLKIYDKMIDVEKDGFISQNVSLIVSKNTNRTLHKGFLWERVNPIKEEEISFLKSRIFIIIFIINILSLYILLFNIHRIKYVIIMILIEIYLIVRFKENYKINNNNIILHRSYYTFIILNIFIIFLITLNLKFSKNIK